MGNFGGEWTRDKLDMVESYLDAYTTALKKKSFQLVYIDAFAGTGTINLRNKDKDARQFLEGSAIRAKNIDKRPFDKILLVEKNRCRHAELRKRMNADQDPRIHIFNEDANSFLKNLSCNWHTHRGVLFLDPFATEVEWSTIENIESFKALDTWMLFPTMAIMRLLPRDRLPDEKYRPILNRAFGDKSWKNLYHRSSQLTFFNDDLGNQKERDKGPAEILGIYKKRLQDLYGNRFMEDSATFRNSTNAQLFELIFCVGNPGKSAIRTAKRIAKHIVNSASMKQTHTRT